MKTLFVLAFYLCSCLCQKEEFAEELLIRQLAPGHVYSLFEFTTKWDVDIFTEDIPSHFKLFPKSLAHLISKFRVRELHISLTQGRWRYNTWGYPIHTAPTGIELWIWFDTSLTKEKVDQNWRAVVNVLSGQICSSLTSIDPSRTSSPHWSFKPHGVWEDTAQSSQTHLRYATLSRESVCTENLTPWKKMLPCEGKAGLSSLLNALRLYDSSYHSLAIHLRSVCRDESCEESSLELKQTVSSVFDPIHAKLDRGWSLNDLFEAEIQSVCPLASNSRILVDEIYHGSSSSSLSPPADMRRNITVGGNVHSYSIYDLQKHDFKRKFHLESAYPDKFGSSKVTYPYLNVHKHTAGYGEEKGGIVCSIQNQHPLSPMKIIYLDVMPYFVRVYLHTLQIQQDGTKIEPESLSYIPGCGKRNPARLELIITVPALSTVTITISFERVLLDWMSHPPDAHHGFYIGSSVVSVMLPDSTNTSGLGSRCSYKSKPETCTNMDDVMFKRIYSEPLLIVVPTPDFSMPYNVICLTCTVIAIAFGTLFNISTRTFQVESKEEVSTSLKQRLKNKLTSIFRKKTVENNVVS